MSSNNEFESFPNAGFLVNVCNEGSDTTICDCIAGMFIPCGLILDILIICPRYTNYKYHNNNCCKKNIVTQPQISK